MAGNLQGLTQRVSALVSQRPRKRVVASGIAALAVAAVGLSAQMSAPAEASVPSYDRAERYLSLETVNDVSTVAFRDLELSAVKSAVQEQALADAAEQQCLAEAIYYEARSESTRGQKAVAEVIHNRVESRFYPDTICGVVYQGTERALAQGKKNCQFSFTCDGSMERWTPVGEHWDKAQQLAAISIEGAFKEQTRGATHYHTNYVRPVWSKRLKRTTQIGTHKFYLDLPFRRTKREAASEVSVAP